MTVYPPTPPQQRLLWFLEAYSDEHGSMPTIREMAAHLGTKSTSTPFPLLEQLESKGHITRMPGKDRAIALVPQVDLKAENERLRAALQHYAKDRGIYGTVAREALAGIVIHSAQTRNEN